MKENTALRKRILAALFLAIGLILPFITMQIPAVGKMLCPMHIPVLLCGYICGWPYGLLIGIITPLLRGVLFGMPAIFPNAFCMAFERYKIPVYFTQSSNAVWTDRMGTGFSSSICIYRRNLYLGTVSDGRIYKCIAGNSDPACSDPGPGRTFI